MGKITKVFASGETLAASDLNGIVSVVNAELFDDSGGSKVSELSQKVSTIEGKESGWDGKYTKPSGGIPASDLASGVIPNVSGKQDVMLTATSIGADGLVDGTKYTLGTIYSLDLSNLPTTSKGILIYFSTGSAGCTLVYSANTNWLGSSAPTVDKNKNYLVVIGDGVCGISEYNPQTMAE